MALFKELADRIKAEVLKRMASSAGVNARTGTNTLIGSNLYKSVDTKVIDDTIVFEIADYFEYVVRGRKAGWKHRPHKPGTKGIVKSVMEWVERKGIRFKGMTSTKTAWVVLESLEVNDIAARPFINYDKEDITIVLPFLNDWLDEWFNRLFDIITEKIDKYFSA